MSIYENGYDTTKSQKRQSNKGPNLKVDTKKINNDKGLTEIVKQMKTAKGLKTAKEIIYDYNENIVGILQRDNTPYLFDDKELAEFIKLSK